MPKDQPPRKTGRPSAFTQAIADAICARTMGGETLVKICQADEMPGRTTVYSWLNTNEAFAKQFELAIRVKYETWADEIVDIADTPEPGTVTTLKDGKPHETKTGDMVEHRKLRVHARQWLLGRLDARFKDKVQNEMVGKDGAPIVPVINITVGGEPAK